MASVLSTNAGMGDSSHGDDSTERQLCDLLDTLVAIRIDLGHDANGIAASPILTPEAMREVRALVADALASTRVLLGSIVCPAATD